MKNLQKDVKLNITHNSDELSCDEAISTYRDTMDGYEYPIADIGFSAEEFKAIIEELETIFPGIVKYDFSSSKNSIFSKYMHDEFRCYIRGNSIDIYGSFYCQSDEVAEKIWSVYNKHCKDDNDTQLFMYSYSMNGGKVDENVKQIKIKDLDYISPKYYPYIDTEIMFDQFFTDNENILLLVGAPGLGKSKMSTLALKHAFNNTDKLPYDKLAANPALDCQYISVAYVKSTDVLADDNFWRTLEKTTPDFCIIDDLDYMLTKRDAQVMSGDDQVKNAFLNQFLSFTDGVEKHRTKFIITTNQTYSDIDTALLRKGRLFDILELRKLDKHESLDIWLDNGLKEKDFNEVFTTHEILPAELGSEVNKRLNTRISTSTQPYLKEEGISKVEKAGREKKVGL